LIYGWVFKQKPSKESLFDRGSIIFLVVVTIAEVIIHYVIQAQKTGKQNRLAVTVQSRRLRRHD